MISGKFQLARSGFALDLAFTAPSQGVTALFGPSGSGKTTLLRCIAGLEHAQGTLQIGEQVWQDARYFMPVHQRPIGYVFQEASLFSHLSVQDNLLFGFKRIAKTQRKVQLDQVVDWLGLERLIQRKDSNSLSGGERQRVAIGRALLTSPSVLLMDEPLSALDHHSKQDILPYLERLHLSLQIPVLYVSHALEEVTRLADYVLLLEQGKLRAAGPVQETLTLLNLPLAHFDDACAVIEGQISHHDDIYHLSKLAFAGGSLWVGKVEQAIGYPARARVLARDVSIATQAPQGSSINNILNARIEEICDEGPDKVMLRLKVGDNQMLLSRITRRSRDHLGLIVGMYVCAQVKSVALM